MIVLGNSQTLSKSKDWKALIQNSKRRNLFETLKESTLNAELKALDKKG